MESTSIKDREEENEEHERKNDQPDQFLIFNRAIRTKEGASKPEYLPGFMLRELAKAPKSSQRLTTSGSGARTESGDGVLAWTERGPGNVPGRTIALLDLPGDANHNTWLAGAATGGIWKTTNGGSSWINKSQNFSVLPISSLAMSASNSSTVYAGTGEYVSSLTTAIGDGIFKSSDQGETWTQLAFTAGNPDFMVITRIIVDPANPNTVIASCVPPEYTSGEVSTIQRSTDGGNSWTNVYEASTAIEQIIASPGSFDTLYAAQHGVGVLKSIDAGNTWALSNTGMLPDGRIEMAVSPVKTNRIFASAEGTLSGTGSDLYMSDNAGATWSLVNVSLNDSTVDFLGEQGFYDNTIGCDPFTENIVYFGGVNYFRTTLTSGSASVTTYALDQTQTTNYITLIDYGASYGNGELTVGTSANASVQIRFGPGQSQKAHRFLVPVGATSGVAAQSYTYEDYVDVNFEVWDVTNNRQLMVSFRDQGRDGTFNLIDENTTDSNAANQSREYIYVNNVTYDPSGPNSNIATDGGQVYNEMYFIWPVLTTGATWPPSQDVTLNINLSSIEKLNASTITVVDAYDEWDGKNESDQTNLTLGVHADQHGMAIIPINTSSKTYKFLLGNDGGVFVSNVSTTPGINNGDIKFAGYALNTSQFYGADKRPGYDQYIGGMQDNGTRMSPNGVTAALTTGYTYAVGGDGFDVIWHNLNGAELLGCYYNNNIMKSVDGGQTWNTATSGMTGAGSDSFPFYTKLTNSKSYPDRVFSVGTSGVYVSANFGGSWSLTPITSNFIGADAFADVEVSEANANIVWAGSGMSSTSNLFVSIDGGKTFQATSNYSGATLGTLTKFASHPTQDSTAFALFSFANSPKILRTTDLGQSWVDISGFGSNSSSSNGFPDVATFCLYVRPDNPSIIWAGTEIGIVESLDNGNTWAILDAFPHVAVWDMKGQDDEVVIATHGRGIWTATIGATQMVNQNPVILAAGTSPQSQFALEIHLPVAYDSTQIVLNSVVVGTLPKSDTGVYIVDISNVAVGTVLAQLIGYTGSSPTASISSSSEQLRLKSYEQEYFNLFSSATDFYTSGFSIASFGTTKSLQSSHPNGVSSDFIATLLQPIIVGTQNPNFYYGDVAIIAPDGDYVVVEGTKDGVTWTPINPKYDATSNSVWLNAYTGDQQGDESMQVDHVINLTHSFAVGDTLLFRFRLHSNAATTAWGWSLDDLYIQQVPTGLEKLYTGITFQVFPNPANGPVDVQFTLGLTTPVTLFVYDLSGNEIGVFDMGTKQEGEYVQRLPSDLKAGIYLVKMKTTKGQQVEKLIVLN